MNRKPQYLIIGLDISQHDLVRVEAFPVDQLLHGLLTHRPHVVRQRESLLGQQGLLGRGWPSKILVNGC